MTQRYVVPWFSTLAGLGLLLTCQIGAGRSGEEYLRQQSWVFSIPYPHQYYTPVISIFWTRWWWVKCPFMGLCLYLHIQLYSRKQCAISRSGNIAVRSQRLVKSGSILWSYRSSMTAFIQTTAVFAVYTSYPALRPLQSPHRERYPKHLAPSFSKAVVFVSVAMSSVYHGAQRTWQHYPLGWWGWAYHRLGFLVMPPASNRLCLTTAILPANRLQNGSTNRICEIYTIGAIHTALKKVYFATVRRPKQSIYVLIWWLNIIQTRDNVGYFAPEAPS